MSLCYPSELQLATFKLKYAKTLKLNNPIIKIKNLTHFTEFATLYLIIRTDAFPSLAGG